MLENRMLVETEWRRIRDLGEVDPDSQKGQAEKLRGPGYEEIGTGVFVADEDAFGFALEKILQDDELRQELVDWFYFYNWIKV